MSNSVFRLYAVPRRFDVATMMAVTLAYALLFGVLRVLQIRPIDVLKVGGFFACVGMGQAVLFRGKKPRLSSMLTGAAYIVGAYGVNAITREPSLLQLHFMILLIWLAIASAGAICGYFAGVAVGAVFLVSDVLRSSIHRRGHR